MRIDVYQGGSGLWYWRLVARNGKIIADGAEGYASKSNARRAVNRVRAFLKSPRENPVKRA